MAVTCKLLLAVFFASFGTSFQWYNLSVTNNVFEIQKHWLNRTFQIHYHNFISEQTYYWLWSLANSAILIGALTGALFTKFLSEKLGRKTSLLISGAVNTIGAILAALSYWLNSVEVFTVARFIMGLSLGAGTGVASIFVSEIASESHRGACGSFQQIMASFGNLVSFVVTLPSLLGTADKWYLAAGLPGIPAALQTVAFAFLPESPKHLILTEGNEAGGRKSSQGSGPAATEAVLAEIHEEQAAFQYQKQYTFYDVIFGDLELRKPMVLALIMQAGVQLGGQGPLFVYSDQILVSAGLSKKVGIYASAGLGLANFLASFVALGLVDTLGRRKLMLGAMWIRIASMAGIIILLKLSQYLRSPSLAISIIPLFYIFMAGSCITLSLAIFVIPTEIFPQTPRAVALTVIGFQIWFLQLLTVFLYLPWEKLVGVGWSFTPFLIFMFLTVLYLHIRLPETRGETIEEIYHHFTEITTQLPEEEEALRDHN